MDQGAEEATPIPLYYTALMEHGIHSRIRRRKHPDNYYREVEETQKRNRAPNILRRDFTAELPPDVVREAFVHNDQGTVYWSNGWVKLCEELGGVRCISRRGNYWNNALSVDFFSAIKIDLVLNRQGYRDLLTTEEGNDLVNDTSHGTTLAESRGGSAP